MMDPRVWDDMADVYAERCHVMRTALERVAEGVKRGDDPEVLARRINAVLNRDLERRQRIEDLAMTTIRVPQPA